MSSRKINFAKQNSDARPPSGQFAALRRVIYTLFSNMDAVMSVTDRTGALIFHAQAHIPA
jgi:hypothetical protein